MWNLIQNLPYFMCVEEVDAAWNSLATLITSCITIDKVLAKHGEFLNHFMLSSLKLLCSSWLSTLLRISKGLLSD